MKTIHVIIGIIINERNQVLIDKRPNHLEMGGWWEFPGGKVNYKENVMDALKRELNEELGIIVKKAEPFMKTLYEHPDKVLILDVWWVNEYQGTPQGREGQEIRWISAKKMNDVKLLEPNQKIVINLNKQLSYFDKVATQKWCF